jgi:hypothetical protein
MSELGENKESTQLSSCPFCGGVAEYVVEGDVYKHKVKCKGCGATAGGSAFKNDVYNAKKWNRRGS